eukprot:PhF_6_TR8785/c0_g1_i1/m.13921
MILSKQKTDSSGMSTILTKVVPLVSVILIVIHLTMSSPSGNNSSASENVTPQSSLPSLLDPHSTQPPTLEDKSCVEKLHGEKYVNGGFKTDKYNVHHYEHVYAWTEIQLEKFGGKFSLLEIGVGCGMNYGMGGGYVMWQHLHPNVIYNTLEYSIHCRKALEFCQTEPVSEQCTKLHSKELQLLTLKDKVYLLKHAVWGSQAEAAVMDEAQKKFGPFQLIVDDASHVPIHQVTSFVHLYPKLEPDGVFVIEDLWTSFLSQKKLLRNLKQGHAPQGMNAVHFLENVYRGMLGDTRVFQLKDVPPSLAAISNATKSICCGREICALKKKGADPSSGLLLPACSSSYTVDATTVKDAESLDGIFMRLVKPGQTMIVTNLDGKQQPNPV